MKCVHIRLLGALICENYANISGADKFWAAIINVPENVVLFLLSAW